MLRGMSAKLFREWVWYAELEPFEEHRADLRIAHIVQTLLNIYRDTEKRPFPYKLKEVMLELDTPTTPPKPKVQNWQRWEKMARSIATVNNQMVASGERVQDK